MSADRRRHWRHLVAGSFTLLAVCGCGASPITAARIETALATTFGNLAHLQVESMGLPPIAARELVVTARCRRPVAGSDTGSGDWECAVMWKGPGRQALGDTYDLFVTTEGCYTATVISENVGGPVLRTSDGREFRNLLYTFEGCFNLPT